MLASAHGALALVGIGLSIGALPSLALAAIALLDLGPARAVRLALVALVVIAIVGTVVAVATGDHKIRDGAKPTNESLGARSPDRSGHTQIRGQVGH